MDVWIQAISTVGFPIACCSALFWFINNTLKDLREQQQEMKETLITLQVANKQLSDVLTNISAILQELVATKEADKGAK